MIKITKNKKYISLSDKKEKRIFVLNYFKKNFLDKNYYNFFLFNSYNMYLNFNNVFKLRSKHFWLKKKVKKFITHKKRKKYFFWNLRRILKSTQKVYYLKKRINFRQKDENGKFLSNNSKKEFNHFRWLLRRKYFRTKQDKKNHSIAIKNQLYKIKKLSYFFIYKNKSKVQYLENNGLFFSKFFSLIKKHNKILKNKNWNNFKKLSIFRKWLKKRKLLLKQISVRKKKLRFKPILRKQLQNTEFLNKNKIGFKNKWIFKNLTYFFKSQAENNKIFRKGYIKKINKKKKKYVFY